MTTKAEIVAAVATATDSTKAAVERFMDALNDATVASLKKGEEVPVLGLGKMKVAKAKAREQKAPNGELIKIPARNVAKMVVAKAVKDALNPAKAAKATAKK